MYPWLSKTLYYAIQTPSGQKLYTHLKKLEETQWYAREDLKKLQWEKLKRLLHHAYEHISYYQKQFKKLGLSPEDIDGPEDFRKFPFLTKDVIRNNLSELKARNIKHFVADCTSGSTGTPLTFFKERSTSGHFLAAKYRGHRWHNFDIGDREVKFWGLPIDQKPKWRERIKDFILNRTLFVAFDISRETLRQHFKVCQRIRPKYMYGYASALYRFARFLDEERIDATRLNLKGIISTSEVIYDFERELIEHVFGCRVINEYGACEVGVMAFECPEGKMHITVENGYLEILKENQQPATPGEIDDSLPFPVKRIHTGRKGLFRLLSPLFYFFPIIYAVGDIMLGDHSHYLSTGIGSRLRQGKLADPFEHVKHLLRKGDIVLGNLETVLSKRTIRYGFNKIDLRGEPSWAKLLAEAGFNVISVANNHAMQHGIGAWYESIRNLSDAGINVVGVKKEPILILECKGMRISILGFSLRPPQYGALSPPYCLASTQEVRESVNQAKRKADMVILSLHWGDEYSFRPSQEQLQIGESFIRSGATLIVGHHPHVLQGIERRRRGIIAYSLGNFVSDMITNRSRQSAILSLNLSEKGIEGLRLIPILIGEDSYPYLLDSKEDEFVMESIKKYDACLGLSKKVNAQTEYPKEIKKTIKQFRYEFMKWLIYNWRKYSLLALFWIMGGIAMRKLLLPVKWLRNK